MSSTTHRRALPALVAAVVLALTLPGAAAARPWSAPATLTSFTAPAFGYASIPSVEAAVLPNGDQIYVVQEQSSAGYRLVSRRRAAGSTTLGAPQQITPVSSQWTEAPFLAQDGQGRLTAVWLSGRTVLSTTLATPTGSWSAVTTAYSVPFNVDYAYVADFLLSDDGSGAFVLHNVVEGYSADSIVAVPRKADGTWDSPEILQDSIGALADPDLAINGDGDLAAAWNYTLQYSETQRELILASANKPKGGAWVHMQTEASGIYGDQNNDPSIAIDDTGLATIVWEKPGDGTTSLWLKRQTGIETWNAAIPFVTPGQYRHAENPILGADAAGNLDLVFTSRFTGAPGQSHLATTTVSTIRRLTTGDWGPITTLSTGTNDIAPDELIVHPSGEAAMVWQSQGTRTSTANRPPRSTVFAHRPVGEGWSPPETVASWGESLFDAYNGGYPPEMDFRPGADAAIVWGRLPDGRGEGVAEASWGRPSPPDHTPPETTIDSGTQGTAAGSAASFAFSAADETGAPEVDPRFECRLDRGPRPGLWSVCASPVQYTDLGPAPYTFRVRAIDASSNVDPSPATRSFTRTPLGGAAGGAVAALDGTFGQGGRVFDWGSGGSRSLLAMPGGRLVAGTDSATLTAFNADGSLDTSFGTDGEAMAEFSSPGFVSRSASDITRTPDGKIVTATTYTTGCDESVCGHMAGIARFSGGGTPDASFGDGGRTTLNMGMSDDVKAVVVGSDLKPIIVGDSVGPGTGRDITIARLNADSTLDTTYGGDDGDADGFVVDNPSRYHCFAVDAVLQPDDKLVVAGNCGEQFGGGTDNFLARYLPDGTRDTSFGQNGFVMTDVYLVSALALAPDGRLVVAGEQASAEEGRSDVATQRFTTSGTPDTSFGPGGWRVLPYLGTSNESAEDILVQPDGKVVTAGSAPGVVMLTRQNADGSPDTGFDGDGVKTQGFGTVDADAAAVVQVAGGDLVVAGDALLSGVDERGLLARFEGVAPADTTPPDSVIDSGPSGTHTSASASFAFHATEPSATFECRLDRPTGNGEWETCASPKTYADLANGAHTFRVRATDAAGNADATEATRSFTVQPPAPAPANDHFADAFVITGGSYSVTGNNTGATKQAGEASHAGNAGGASVWWRWTAPAAGPVTIETCGSTPDTIVGVYTGSAVGATVEVGSDDDACAPGSRVQFTAVAGTTYFIAVDGYGGATGAFPFSFTGPSGPADTTPPETTLAGSGPSGTIKTTSAQFAFTSSEAGSTFECKLDTETSYSPCSSPKTYPTIAAGDRTFSVRAKDPAGNVDPTPATRSWTVDTTPPQSAFTGTLPAATTSSASATFTYASEPGATFECKLDDGAWQAGCGTSRTLSSLAEGSHTFQVRATDAAGNTDLTPASHTWRVDLTPPTTTIRSGPAGTTSATSARFELGASEEGAALSCSTDGAAFAPCGPIVTLTGLGEGDHELRARARDAAGHDGPVVTRAWTVDTTAPVESHQVAAGGSVVPSPPSAGDPVASQITSPNAGEITVADEPTDTPAPTGYTLLGQQVAITAPAGTVDAPLRLVFRIDSSALPAGVDETNVVVFRNGAAAALCAASDGRAAPTPCVAQRRRLGDGDGDVEVTVLTVQASTWNFGRANTPPKVDEPPAAPTPPAGPSTPAPPEPTPPGPPAPGPQPPAAVAPRIAVSFPPRVKLLPSLRNGFVVQGTTSTAATISATVSITAATAKRLKLGRKALVVARSSGSFGAGGFSLEFRSASRLRKKLGKAKTLPLVLKGTAAGPGGTTTFTKQIALRR